MLRGAYSYLTPFSRFVLLIILVFSFMLFSVLFSILLLVPFYGSGILEVVSNPDYTDPSAVTALKVIQILNMAGGLLLPALIYLWLCTPTEARFKGFAPAGSPVLVLLSAVLIVISQPLIGWASELNSYLSLPEWLAGVETWMKAQEDLGVKVTEAFLSTTTAGGLLVNIFMIAVLPAVAEEILFRGVLADLFKDWTRNTHLAVIISALIFAAIHLQFYGFMPRFLLGVVLGYLFFWSGSLWLPVAAHFTNNFLSVMVEFLFRKGMINTNAEKFGMDSPALLSGLSFIAVVLVLYWIYRRTYILKKE